MLLNASLNLPSCTVCEYLGIPWTDPDEPAATRFGMCCQHVIPKDHLRISWAEVRIMVISVMQTGQAWVSAIGTCIAVCGLSAYSSVQPFDWLNIVQPR